MHTCTGRMDIWLGKVVGYLWREREEKEVDKEVGVGRVL